MMNSKFAIEARPLKIKFNNNNNNNNNKNPYKYYKSFTCFHNTASRCRYTKHILCNFNIFCFT